MVVIDAAFSREDYAKALGGGSGNSMCKAPWIAEWERPIDKSKTAMRPDEVGSQSDCSGLLSDLLCDFPTRVADCTWSLAGVIVVKGQWVVIEINCRRQWEIP
jgi:hypothetical protein